MLKKLLAWKEDNLDERQIQQRSIIYRNALFATLALQLANIWFIENEVVWHGSFYANTLTVFIAAIYVICAQFWRGIYPMSVAIQRVFVVFMALCSLFFWGTFLLRVTRGEDLATGLVLSSAGILLIMGILSALPPLFFALSRRRLERDD